MESKIEIKHLEIIQGVINRLASNSFKMKGWSIGLITAFYAFIFSQDASIKWYAFLVPLIPAFGFWLLDAYYLRLEKLFRKVYEWVVDCHNGLRTDYKPFYMNYERFSNDVPCTFGLMLWNRSVTVFHLPLIGIVITFLILKLKS